MPTARLITAASLAALLAAAPALTPAAFARPAKASAAKASSKSKAKEAPAEEAAAPKAAPVDTTTAENTTSSADEQQIATSNPSANIPAVLQASGQFTTLLNAVQATNLTSVVSSPARPLTVFAPTDEAFAALGTGVVQALMEPANAQTLQSILTYHVIATKVPASQIRGKAAAPVQTANGAKVSIGGTGGTIKVGDATVIQSDVQASNGVIHVIDKVLIPPGTRLPAAALPGSGPTTGVGGNIGANAGRAPGASVNAPTAPPSPRPATGTGTATGAATPPR